MYAELQSADSQRTANHIFDADQDGTENRDEERHDFRDQKRPLVGIIDRNRLRHHLREDEQQYGHDASRVEHAVVADNVHEDVRGESR